jgi:hypothetical protein
MKNQHRNQRSKFFAGVLTAAAFALIGCNNLADDPASVGLNQDPSVLAAHVEIDGITCVPLLSRSADSVESPIGEVCASIVGDRLKLKVASDSGIDSTRLWAGTMYDSWPKNQAGAPLPTQFPYSNTGIGGDSSATHIISLADLGIICDTTCDTMCAPDTLYLLLQVAGNGDTAWGGFGPGDIDVDNGTADLALAWSLILKCLPPPAVPTTKDQCKKDGWLSLVDDLGNSFKNQGDCVRFVATKGKNKAAGN